MYMYVMYMYILYVIRLHVFDFVFANFLIAISSSLHLHNVEVVRSVCICHLLSIFIKSLSIFSFFDNPKIQSTSVSHFHEYMSENQGIINFSFSRQEIDLIKKNWEEIKLEKMQDRWKIYKIVWRSVDWRWYNSNGVYQ